MTPQQIEKKAAEKQTAVSPLNVVAIQDVGKAAKVVDDWLKSISYGYVTLEVIKNVAGALPVIGNIMALVDVLCDIIAIVTSKTSDGVEAFFNWVSLGINLIGVIPLPPSMAAARMSLRPTLHLVRQELRTAAHDIGEAIVVMLVGHLNATIAGEIDKFIDGAIERLADMLDGAASKCEGMLGSWSDGLRKLAAGEVLALDVPSERPNYDPKATYGNFFAAAWGSVKNTTKKAANYGVGAAIRTSGADKLLISNADLLKALATRVKSQLKKQANKEAEKSIAWLLQKLKQAVVRALSKGKRNGAVINPATTAKSDKEREEGRLAAVSAQVPSSGDPNRCKDCANAATPHPGSISFATGSETFTHTDFALPGHMPMVWSRTYYSRLGAYDSPKHSTNASSVPTYMGARWTSPYTTRIEQARDGSLCYFAADGREHRFPKLAAPSDDEPGKTGQTGQTHHNSIEDLTLGRGNDALLILSHGRDYVETFELAPAFLRDAKPSTRNKAACYRLASQRTRTGHTTELAYSHEGGQLSDIVSGQTHVCTALDTQGRIQSLWLVQEGQAVRELAAYTYQNQADGSSDLVSARDENQHTWQYEYLRPGEQASTHLISRYTDRTGRGTQLQWMHEDGFSVALSADNSVRAKAYREWTDDGSFDTTLIWNKHIRLTTVIDALGGETLCYYDILGYTYRIVHPEVRGADGKLYLHGEWFLRDTNKNITRHVHPDGSQDCYTYDVHSSLVSHTRADGSTVHFAHDEMDNLTGIRDAEGHAWKRTYDGVNLVEEIDPLGHKTEYAYNEAGLPVEITDAKGGKKQLAYDGAGQLTAYTDCSGKTSSWAYDDRGRLVKESNAAGEATQYHYERGQLARITNPDGAQEQLEHDAEGRLLVHRDALQRETRYEYNAVGLIAQRLDANRNTIDYQWDRLGRLTTLRNENGCTHSFSYDPLGKLLSEVQFDGSKTMYGYTPATGGLHQVNEGDAVTQFEFDPAGRIIKRSAALYIEPKDLEGRLTGRTLDRESVQTDSYAYDGNGRLIDARNAHIRLQWFPDAVGNVKTEHHHYLIDDQGRAAAQPMTAVWQHRYDELGNRIRTTRPDGHKTTWLTYGSGHVHGLMLDDIEALQIERDDLHREVKRTQANQVAQEQQYDPAGRLKAQVLSRAESLARSPGGTHSTPNARALGIRRNYSYDRAGQLTDIGDSRRGSLSYRYDPVGRLLQAQSQMGAETFAFDPASNILDPMAPAARQAGAINNIPAVLNNLVKDYAGTHFEYDSRGNMVRRLHNGQNTRFTWDALGRLTGARTQDTRTTFMYDSLGRRIAKRSEPIVIASSMDGSRYLEAETQRQTHERGLGTVLFGWDGDQMAWESDATRNRTVHYVFEPDSFVPLLQARTDGKITQSFLKRPASATSTYVDADGNYDLDRDPLHNGMYEPGFDENGEPPPPLKNIHYYQCDHLGTPMELTNEEGNVAWEANYKAWGEARLTISEAAKKAGLKNPIRFQGQYLDEETGLHYNRFRYYDPVVGRFISKDPAGLIAGSNLQEFAPNPIQWIDPFGLWKGQPRNPGGKFGSGQDPDSLAKQRAAACPIGGRVHGNSLDSKLPAVGYVLVDRKSGDIVKFGETTAIPSTSRYSKAEYDAMNTRMRIVKRGSKHEMHCWQHQQILAYKAAHGGERPKFNLSDY